MQTPNRAGWMGWNGAVAGVLLGALSIVGARPAAADGASIADPGFLEQYAATNRFRLGNPTAITLTPEGDAVLFLRSGPRSFVNDLYEFDCATGKERVLLTAEAILKGAEEKLTPEELARRERARSSARGIAGYSMSEDGMKILVPLSGRLFVVERKTGAVRELKSEPGASGGFPIDPRFSPDGTKIALARDGDLYVIDIGTGAPPEGRERRLTTKTDETVTNGLAEFAAQEEMGRNHGFWWSPDSAMLAFEQADTKGMETFRIADPTDPGKPAQEWAYPRAGSKNAAVRLGVLNLKSGAREGGLPGTPDPVWIKWDAEKYPYLATVKWEKNGPLSVRVQNRAQTEQQLLAADPTSGETALIVASADDAWINLDQAFPKWISPDRALVTTERMGAWQLVEFARSGAGGAPGTWAPSLIGSSKDFNYRGGLLGFDEAKSIAYVAGGEDPTQIHVFRVRVSDGAGTSEQITTAPGLHSASFSKDCSTCVHAFQGIDGAQSWTVRRVADWSPIGELKSVCERPSFPINIEVTSVTAKDAAEGLDSLGFKKGADIAFNALLIRPRNFEKGKKHPVIVSVYAGPHSQTVLQGGTGQSLNQWYADHGFIVVSIDGRGTPARGRAWERAIKGDLSKIPLIDQVAGLKALGAKYAEMDMSRVGIYGWSFGGYFSAMAVMREPGVYACGVAGAPVADWRDYDTHYTERYMGMPQDNKAGYDAASVLTYCKDLTRPLLIIHGTADDNVYFMHSLKMSNALFRAGKAHEFLPLAGFTHMVPDPVVVKSLYGRIAEYFEEHLKK